MIHLNKTKKDPDRKLFADVIAKAIQESGIKAYPEYKYKNILGGNMNIILPKSRPFVVYNTFPITCLLYTSPSPRDGLLSRMPSSA